MKNYLVIGGSSGIGRAIVNQLNNAGHQVFATFNENEYLSKGNVQFKKYDVTKYEFSIDWLPEQLDGLVYCPGSINLKPFKGFNREDFVTDFDLQVGGAVEVIQQTMKALRKSGNGSIVLFSTVAVQKGYPFHAQVAASKGAIEGLTRALAAELSPKIRVNCIAPSLTDTPLAGQLLNNDEKKQANAQRNPMKRLGQPEDLAQTACFLLSEQSNWITGQILHVDGGASTLAK